jgi:hypothetical protein
MQMLKKLFNSESKYHLELDETEGSEAVQAAVKTTEKSAKKAAKVVKEKAVEVKAEAASKVVDTAEAVVETPPTAQDNGASAIASNSKPGKQKPAKATTKTTAKGKGKEAEQVVQATAKKSAASSYEPPFWVAAMNNTNTNGSSNGSGQGGEVTFASDNLMPTISKYRRLPGGSLAKFREMAKTAKTPRK